MQRQADGSVETRHEPQLKKDNSERETVGAAEKVRERQMTSGKDQRGQDRIAE